MKFDKFKNRNQKLENFIRFPIQEIYFPYKKFAGYYLVFYYRRKKTYRQAEKFYNH